jgi:photosystem II stability/assembly factor-like uncharacterized protein
MLTLKISLLVFILSISVSAQWYHQNSGTQSYLYDLEFVSADTGWVVGQGGTILKTTDGGTNWIQQNSNTTKNLYSVSFIDHQNGWVGGEDGVLVKTSDGGISWQPGIIFSYILNIYGLVFINDSIVCAAIDAVNTVQGYYSKILRTTDHGNSWVTAYEFDGASFFDFATVQNKVWSIGMSITGSSTNYGETWNVLYSPTDHWLFGVYFVDELNGWAVGGGTDTELILNSTDGGDSWQVQKLSYQFKTLHGIYFTDFDNGWTVGADGHILKTINGGVNWFLFESPTTNYLRKIQFPKVNIGYAVGANGTIIKYLGDSIYVKVIEPNGGDTLLVGSSYAISWDSQNIIDVKIDYSIDDGLNWINIMDSLQSSDIYEWIVPNTITSQGRIRISDLDDSGIFDISDEAFYIDYPVSVDDPSGLFYFNLSQNYPIPFNPTTSLRYAIGCRQFVTLKVYDLLGREIAILVNEEKSAGEYEVEFSAIGGSASGGNAYNLPSGIYFYQLKAGEFSETRKMVLLR